MMLENDGYNIDQVAFTLTEEDPYNLGKIEKISLYLGDTLIAETTDANTYCFSDLEVNKTYRVEVEYTYDLFDDKPVRTRVYKREIVAQSCGLEIVNGMIKGKGTCTDTELYINMPIIGRAFYGDYNISSLHLGAGVTSIGANAFEECIALTQIQMDEGIEKISECVFYGCRNIASVDIPESVTYIGNDAFMGCAKMTTVTIPSSADIKHDAFWECRQITTVKIRNISAWCVNGYDFRNLSDVNGSASISLYVDGKLVSDLAIPNGVTKIAAGVFSHVNSIKSVIIPNTVINIEDCAFYDCKNLESVTLPEGLKTLAGGAFADTAIPYLYIPESVTLAGPSDVPILCVAAKEKPLIWSDSWYRYNVVWGVNEIITDDQGLIYVITDTDKILVYCPNGASNVAIPNDVTLILDSVFKNNTTLTGITLPHGITGIGSRAFENCTSLASITIPNSVISIGDSAFISCNKLTSINYNGTKSQWELVIKERDWDMATGHYTVYCTD